MIFVICLSNLVMLRGEYMKCSVRTEFIDSDFSDDETLKYFGEDFWLLMNESCGNYDLTLSAIAFISYIIGSGKKHVCDLMCGNGRHAIGLNSLGYAITAIDARFDIIENIKNNICRSDLEWLSADVYESLPFFQYDAITILTSSLGYYGKNNDKALLSSCYDRLCGGGKLILDLPNGDEIIRNFVKKDWIKVQNVYYLFQYVLVEQTKYTKMTVVDGINRREYSMKMYLYKVNEMVELLKSVGFRKIVLYGDFCFKSIQDTQGKKRIQIVATKR